MAICVIIPTIIVCVQHIYHNVSIYYYNYTILLSRGIDLDGTTIGIAFIQGMCTPLSVGVTQDGGMPLATAITTATHEMGHNFNMRHDDEGNITILVVWLNRINQTSIGEVGYLKRPISP